MDDDIDEYRLFDGYWTDMSDYCTEIEILHPNGIEFWHVENFKGGVGVSKWYRGISNDALSENRSKYGRKMAQLNILGLDSSMIEKYHYEFLKKPIKTDWVKFAERLVHSEAGCFIDDHIFIDGTKKRDATSQIDILELKTQDTVSIDATLEIRYFDRKDQIRRIFKSYTGKSTRPWKKTRRPKNEKEEMTNEAKKAALIECFKDRFGFTEFNDIMIDEFRRPVTA